MSNSDLDASGLLPVDITETFPTDPSGLRSTVGWLNEHKVAAATMEGTGQDAAPGGAQDVRQRTAQQQSVVVQRLQQPSASTGAFGRKADLLRGKEAQPRDMAARADPC